MKLEVNTSREKKSDLESSPCLPLPSFSFPPPFPVRIIVFFSLNLLMNLKVPYLAAFTCRCILSLLKNGFDHYKEQEIILPLKAN